MRQGTRLNDWRAPLTSHGEVVKFVGSTGRGGGGGGVFRVYGLGFRVGGGWGGIGGLGSFIYYYYYFFVYLFCYYLFFFFFWGGGGV